MAVMFRTLPLFPVDIFAGGKSSTSCAYAGCSQLAGSAAASLTSSSITPTFRA
jgi:hypothetical protein